MSRLPDHPSFDHLRKQAKRRRRDRGIALNRAQRDIAREYGFANWPALARHVQAAELSGPERVLVLAEPTPLAALLREDRSTATAPVGDLPPLLVLLRRARGTVQDVRHCTRLLLDAGADPDSHATGPDGCHRRTAVRDAVERGDAELVRMLVEHGATRDDDVFYHACEHGGTRLLDLLYAPGFENLVNHKLDFEDVDGLRWFLDRGVDVDANRCLHHAIARGRSLTIIGMLLDAGADVDLPWDRWDVGRRPLALAARCGHLAAYDLLAGRGATAELDPVDTAVLAVARGASVRLPAAAPPVLGTASDGDYGWILGQFALLGRDDVVAGLLDAGMAVDTRGWSNFTPLDQAAMHGRADTVRLLVARGAALDDCAFDDEGPTPLDCALWGLANNRAGDGDYPGTVEALLAAGAPTGVTDRTGDAVVDAVLSRHGVVT